MNNIIEIRKAVTDDVPALAELEVQTSASPWSDISLFKDIQNVDGAIVLVAVIENKIAGYADAWVVADELQLNNIAVFDECRRNGVAEALLGKLVLEGSSRTCNSITLEVRVGNKAARSLYEKFGFVTDGIRKKYYEDNGEDAVLMSKIIDIIE